MLDIQTLSIAIAAVSVVAGVIYSSIQLRNQTKARQTDLVMRYYATFATKEFQDSWEQLLAREVTDHVDMHMRACILFEGVGVLLHRKLIDISLVDDLFSYPIKRIWEKVKPLVVDARKSLDSPQLYEWFEYLYN